MATFDERIASARAALGAQGTTDHVEVERFVRLHMSQRALDQAEAPAPTTPDGQAAAGPSIIFGEMVHGDGADPEFLRIYGEMKTWFEARKPA